MIKKYIGDSDSDNSGSNNNNNGDGIIMLCVIPSNVDFSTAECVMMGRSNNNSNSNDNGESGGRKMLVVVTKCDLAEGNNYNNTISNNSNNSNHRNSNSSGSMSKSSLHYKLLSAIQQLSLSSHGLVVVKNRSQDENEAGVGW